MAAARLPIQQAAEQFAASYGRAMALADPDASPHAHDLALVAAAMGAHYGATVALNGGHQQILDTADAAAEAIEAHLGRFDRAGFGTNVSLRHARVEPLGDQAAVCWLTWAIAPRAGSCAGWTWVSVYTYRRSAASTVPNEHEQARTIGRNETAWTKPEGRWEVVIVDEEFAELLQRVPSFLDL